MLKPQNDNFKLFSISNLDLQESGDQEINTLTLENLTKIRRKLSMINENTKATNHDSNTNNIKNMGVTCGVNNDNIADKLGEGEFHDGDYNEDPNDNRKIANIICIKWGKDVYNANDVNILYAMVKRNINDHKLRFFCFTDDTKGLKKGIIAKKIPEIDCDPADLKHVYRKIVGLCDDNLGGLAGQRVLFFDLDVVITRSLDEMVSYPQNNDFVTINDWNSIGNKIGQASCYSWIVGSLGYIKTDFEKQPKQIFKQYFTASQQYLSAKVIEKYGELKFWPESWCKSFKLNLLPPWYLRAFIQAKLPKETKVIAFHGVPKVEDAIKGTWDARKGIPFYKKVYKTIRAHRWLEKYWCE